MPKREHLVPRLLARNAARIRRLLAQPDGHAYDMKPWGIAVGSVPGAAEDVATVEARFQSTLSRDILTLLADESLAAVPGAARRFYIATMIWGWGEDRSGRGRKNLRRGLTDAGLDSVLSVCLHEVVEGRLLDAYRHFTVNGCGQAFFTKLFYFAGKARGCKPMPVILDRNVAVCLEVICVQEGWSLDAFVRARRAKNGRIDYLAPDGDRYVRFVECINSWADGLGLPPDAIEQFMYQHRGTDRTASMTEGGMIMTPALPSEGQLLVELSATEHRELAIRAGNAGLSPSELAATLIRRGLSSPQSAPTTASSLPPLKAKTEPRVGGKPDVTAIKQRLLGSVLAELEEPDRSLFLRAPRFKHWANFTAGYLLTRKGMTDFTPADIWAALESTIPELGQPTLQKNEVCTADVRPDSEYHESFPCLERVGHRTYRFIGFAEARRRARVGD